MFYIMGKQKLSKKAAKAKAERDLRYAKTRRRTRMRSENQKRRREAKKNGKNIDGMDYDHNRKRFVSIRTNRSATKTTNNTLRRRKKK